MHATGIRLHSTWKGIFLVFFLLFLILTVGCLEGTPDEDSDSTVVSPPSLPHPTAVSTAIPVPGPMMREPFPFYLTRTPSVTYPEIIPGDNQGIDSITISYQFPFGSNGLVELSVPVNISVYRGAHQSSKNITLHGEVPREILLREYYLSFVGDPHQDEFFETLLGEFRRYRLQWNLSNDEYLELLTTYVQSLPYQNHPGGSKFPIETLVENGGDCDDKALLLSGLLAREGYNISLLYFEDEHHVAVGVASSAYAYQDTGYAFVETTSSSYVGAIPETVRGIDSALISPEILRLGTGARVYESGTDVEKIISAREEAEQAIRAALPFLSVNRTELSRMATEGKLEELYRETHGQDQLYGAFVNQVRTYLYIQSHSYDRKGTMEWLNRL